jgi:hypothetical protein
MATYNGNQNGFKSLFVFSNTGGTNCNFVGTIAYTGTTTQYVAAGGFTCETTAEMNPYRGNNAYLNYVRNSSSIHTYIDPATGVSHAKESVTPDPRAEFGLLVHGTSASFTGDFMDEIHVSHSGGTAQAFAGRFTYSDGVTHLPANTVLVDLVGYGISGGNPNVTNLYTFTSSEAGLTIANKRTGAGSTLAVYATAYRYIDYNSYAGAIAGQIGATHAGGHGVTGITVGDATHKKYILVDLDNKDLRDEIKILLPAITNSGSITASPDRQGLYHTIHGSCGGVNGITFNAITGGTVAGTPEYEEFGVKYGHRYIAFQNLKNSDLNALSNKNNIRAIDELSF